MGGADGGFSVDARRVPHRSAASRPLTRAPLQRRGRSPGVPASTRSHPDRSAETPTESTEPVSSSRTAAPPARSRLHRAAGLLTALAVTAGLALAGSAPAQAATTGRYLVSVDTSSISEQVVRALGVARTGGGRLRAGRGALVCHERRHYSVAEGSQAAAAPAVRALNPRCDRAFPHLSVWGASGGHHLWDRGSNHPRTGAIFPAVKSPEVC